MHIDSRANWPHVVEQVWNGETVILDDYAYRLAADDGERRAWFSHYISPVRDEAGVVCGLWALSIDTTARVDAERQRNSIGVALRESEARHAFLLKLTDALRSLDSSALVQAAATRTLGEHLGATRVCYAEFLNSESDFIIERDYHTPGVSSVAGRYRLDNYGPALTQKLRSGQTVSVPDIRVDPMFEEIERTAYEYVPTRSFVVVPLVKQGRLVAMLSVNATSPRDWTPSEVALVEETAERTWAAVERAGAEAALRESEERFRLMADAVPQIVWVTDFQGNVQFFNQQWFDYTGSPEEHVSTAVMGRDFIHPDDVEATLSAFELARWTGGNYRVEHRLRGLDGQYRWFLVRAQPHRDPVTGVISQWFGASVDIHERRLAEAALKISEERFQQFGNASSNVLWIRDAASLQWSYLTPAFEKVYGMKREEALRGDNFHRWSDLILPEDRQLAIASIRRVAAGESVTFEYRIRRPSDGHIRWMRDTDFPLRDAEGHVTAIGGIGQDITDAHATSEQLQTLVAELQHRSRNLVGVVRSLADKTLINVSSLDDFRERFRDRLGALSRVNSFLAQLDRGEKVTFGQVVERELAALGAEPAQVSVEGPQHVVLRAAAVQTLTLALYELTANAVRQGALATPDGRLVIRCETQDGRPSGRLLVIDWRESGVTTPPSAAGFNEVDDYGREIIEKALPYQLKAETTLSFEEDGVHCTIALPIDPSDQSDSHG
jgi:PAS domain S-box-containing protein